MTGLGLPPGDWFMQRVAVLPSGCWEWQGGKRNEYGHVNYRQRAIGPAHRVAYELLIGPVPDGKQIDHLCRTTLCVNPVHLEPVTQRENILRGVSFSAVNARKTHCPKGHPYSGTNVRIRADGARRCLTCFGPSGRVHPNTLKTHCPRGHEYTLANTYSRPRSGGRQCRTCRMAPHRTATPAASKLPVSARLESPDGLIPQPGRA